MKKLKLAGLVLLVGVLLLRALAAAWARAQWGPYETAWKADVAAERARVQALKRPALHGEAIDENAATKLGAAIAEVSTDRVVAALSSAIDAGPYAPLTDEAKAFLEANRDALAKLREAARCTRVDWDPPYETAMGAPLPNLVKANHASKLFLIEARVRVAAGDLDGAADLETEALKVAMDLGEGALPIQWLIGSSQAGIAARDLARLLGGAPGGSPVFARVAKDLDAVEPIALSASRAMLSERLGARSYANQPGDSGLANVAVPVWELAAWGVVGIDGVLRDAEKACATPDHAQAMQQLQALEDSAQQSRNLMLKIALPALKPWRRTGDGLQARLRILRAMIALEAKRDAQGAFPEKPEGLPLDPFTGKELRYERSADGKRYKLWSVGEDLKDGDGVESKRHDEGDIVAERAER